MDKNEEKTANEFIAYESYMITESDLGQMTIRDKNGVPICQIDKGVDIDNELAGFLLMDRFKEAL